MGSAVRGATSSLSSMGNSIISGGIFGSNNPLASLGGSMLPGGALTGLALGGVPGQGANLNPIQTLVENVIPAVPIADQAKLQGQINTQQALANNMTAQQQAQQAIANQQVGQAQGMIQGQSQQAINQAQGVNQGGNVQSSIGLLGQTAAGGGAAQQAARAQLQAGTDQAIHTQQAMANSGNLAQMIGGQRNAMANAAELQQQNALNASMLQAGMAGQAQGQYAGAAQQQASQAAQNAALQQNQAQQQANLAALSSGQAQGYAGQANTAQGNAMTGQTNALGLQQQALGQTAQYRAQALGGLMNAGGGVATALALSDENTKQNIQFASGPRAGQSYNYGPNPNIISETSDNSQPIPNGVSVLNNSASTPNPIPKKQLTSQQQGLVQKIGSSFDDLGQSTMPQWHAIPLSSDENMKENVNSNDKIKSFLDAIDPVSFKYKEASGEMGKTPGEHLGVIAQQIEAAPHGKSMIIETPKGKGIDIPSAVGTLLAASAELNSRLGSLEDYFKMKKDKK